MKFPYQLNKPTGFAVTRRDVDGKYIEIVSVSNQQELEDMWRRSEHDPGLPMSHTYGKPFTPRLNIELLSKYYPDIISKVEDENL